MSEQAGNRGRPNAQTVRETDLIEFTGQMDRRAILAGATVTAAGVAGLSLLTSGQAEAATAPEKLTPQEGDRFMFIKGADKNKCVRSEMLTEGGRQIEVFPYDPEAHVLRRKNRLNRALVIRLDPAEMDEETRERSVGGVLVYSAICTHKGCTIKSWKQEERHLRCHCHLSEFAALSAGSVKSGPAKRQLPMVALGLDDEGFIVAKGDFTRKPGGSKK